MRQEFFNLEEVTEETKFRFKEPVDYYVFYILVTTTYYEEEKDDWFSVGFCAERQRTKTYSQRIGHLDTIVHNSHVYSIIKQLKEEYNLEKLNHDWFHRNLRIPHEHHIESVTVEYHKDTIREIEIY